MKIEAGQEQTFTLEEFRALGEFGLVMEEDATAAIELPDGRILWVEAVEDGWFLAWIMGQGREFARTPRQAAEWVLEVWA